MKACDVVIVGGGPAGSACAWKLARAGFDVVVADKAVFPRDKVCAGWITPQVLEELQFDPEEYRQGRTLQPITGFCVGVIGNDEVIETSYDRPVSFGIRRCEFDDYLLRRSGARLLVGEPVSAIRRVHSRWIVDERISAPMLVGAGGHFCPVARMLNGALDGAPVVVAQEVEVPLEGRACPVSGERPELYFCRDLAGYGWCFRKGDYINVGIGRQDPHGLPRAAEEFLEFLKARRRIPESSSWRLRGHAYLLSGSPRRRSVDDGVLLVGDAAGLAYPKSGEGIRPAIEAGLMAASAIVAANGRYESDHLKRYAADLERRFGEARLLGLLSRSAPKWIPTPLVVSLLDLKWFVRHVVLDRWFLRMHENALTPA